MLVLRSLAIIAISTFSVSCSGYHLGGAVPKKLQNIRSIVIPQFENNTLNPRLSALATNSIVDAIAQDGTYRVGTENNADAKLVGVIKQIDYEQFRANRFDTLRSDELSATLIIDWKLISMTNNQTLEQGSAKGKTTFFTEANFQTSKRNALPIAAEKAAKNLVISITEGF